MGIYRDWPEEDDLDGLIEFAQEEIIPMWEEDPETDHQDYPTTQWLDENRLYTLRRKLSHHEMSVKTFFSMFLGFSIETRWPTDDALTTKELEEYLSRGERYRQWSDATIETNYYLLKRCVDEFIEESGRVDILELSKDEEHKSEIFEYWTETLYQIKTEAETDDSALQYLRAVVRWYDSLERRGIIPENPIEEIKKEFRWEFSYDGSEPIDIEDVGKLWREAQNLEEKLIIIGYIIWGLRRQEVTKITEEKFTKRDGKLLIMFEEDDRKTGAGEVEILIGKNVIEKQFERGRSHSEWSGHLLYDQDEPGKAMTKEKAANIFQSLSKRAGVEIDGNPATPNNGRAVYNDLQGKTTAYRQEIVEEYGTENAYEAVESALGYQGIDTKEKMRQVIFLSEFKEVLPEGVITDKLVFEDDIQTNIPLSKFD